jgi:hypothetical protein
LRATAFGSAAGGSDKHKQDYCQEKQQGKLAGFFYCHFIITIFML